MRQEARVIWERVVDALGSTGVLTSADRDVLRLYAEAFARYLQAEEMLNKTGPLMKGRDGSYVKNPLHQVVRDNADAVKKYARELKGDIDGQANSATAKLDAIIRAARRA
jgi:P27 family predicted phage terminase small subunit